MTNKTLTVCIVNGVEFKKHSIETELGWLDRNQYLCEIGGYEIDIKVQNGVWIPFIGIYMIIAPTIQDKHLMFEFLASGNWEVPEEAKKVREVPDEVLSPETYHPFGFRDNDWYYDDQLVFKWFYGNSDREYYFGYVKGVEVKVHAHQGRGRYGNWIASIEGDLIPDCNFDRRVDLFKWLVQDWDRSV